MVDKKNKEQEEVMKAVFEEPSVNGFRKGITKKDIVKSLSKEDWIRLDKMKEAEERMANKYSYPLYVKSDQMFVQFERSLMNIDIYVSQIYMLEEAINRNEIDIARGETEQKGADGETMTMKELEANIISWDVKIRTALQQLRLELSSLFTYIEKQGLDKKTFFNEEQYNAKVEDVIHKLSKTRYKLF